MVNARGHVLVTRPEPGASRTAASLDALGFVPVVVPLSETRSLGAAMPAGDPALVVATSGNAVRHADPSVIEKLRHLPAIVVGGRTAELFRAAGFAEVEAADGSAISLAERVLDKGIAGQSVAYLCGRPRRPDLELRLAGSGIDLVVNETYETVRRMPSQADLDRLVARPPDAVLVYSPEGARALESVIPALDPTKVRFFCLSETIAGALPDGCLAHVAERAEEAALLALLARHF